MAGAREFLRLCLRSEHDPAAGAAAQEAIAGGELDWDAVVAAAGATRVAPLLHRLLRNEPAVPAAARTSLRQAYLGNAYRNMVLLEEVERAVAALQAGGVPVIVLKGAVLTETVYANRGVRTLMDVDVLLRRQHLEPAMPILAAAGFSPPRAETRSGAAAAYENELLLLKQAAMPVALEIHWSLFDSPYYQERLDLEQCWADAVPFQFGKTTTLMLDPVSQLLHLCGHLVLHHGGDDLLWEHDIGAFVHAHGDSLDWPRLLQQAQDWDLVIAVRQLLLPLGEGAGALLPAEVADAIRRLEPAPDERRIVGYMTAPERGVAQRFWTDLASMRGWRARLGYAWTHLFPSAEYMRQRYGLRSPLMVFLYYPYRWFRGLRG